MVYLLPVVHYVLSSSKSSVNKFKENRFNVHECAKLIQAPLSLVKFLSEIAIVESTFLGVVCGARTQMLRRNIEAVDAYLGEQGVLDTWSPCLESIPLKEYSFEICILWREIYTLGDLILC